MINDITKRVKIIHHFCNVHNKDIRLPITNYFNINEYLYDSQSAILIILSIWIVIYYINFTCDTSII